MRQVLVIHGGDSFATYEEYFQSLKDFELEVRSGSGWKSNLAKDLGEDYEVLRPSMPNKESAKFEEWKIWFEKYIPYIRDEVILVGHSLGGSFLAKYLSENRLPSTILGTFLVAAPYDQDDGRELVEFAAPSDLALLEEQGGDLFLYHSTDDPVVNFSELAKYRTALPEAHIRTFEDRQHFNQEEFLEIVQDIKSLSAK